VQEAGLYTRLGCRAETAVSPRLFPEG
jgi:hypothetical protein